MRKGHLPATVQCKGRMWQLAMFRKYHRSSLYKCWLCSYMVIPNLDMLSCWVEILCPFSSTNAVIIVVHFMANINVETNVKMFIVRASGWI